jgi:predicted nuclease of predicted toxin-antitoxin system
VKFLVDAQLPPMLAEWLRKAGHEAQHVREVGLLDADDTAIRAYAGKVGAVLITKDRDFVSIGETSVQVVWVRTGNVGTRALIDRVEAALPQVLQHLSEGAQLVELR